MTFNSTIKQKTGICIDCQKEGDETEKNIIAERCGFHYAKHRAKINRSKAIQKGEPPKKKAYSIKNHTNKRLRQLALYKFFASHGFLICL